MTRLLALFLLLTSIAGCSSTEVVERKPNPCVTDWGATVKNGHKVDSYTRVQCTDKPQVEHVVKDIGVASDCISTAPVGITGKNPKYGEDLMCKFTDPMGRQVWRPVNEVLAYPTIN